MKTIITRKRSPNLRKATTKVSNRRARCIICNKFLKGQQTKFCSPKCKSKVQSNSVYRNQQKRGWNRKQKLIESMGGKCQICGYNKYLRALCFHHIDPVSKKISLDMRHLSNRSWKEVEIEAQKCQLLCMNCHMELHDTVKSAALTG